MDFLKIDDIKENSDGAEAFERFDAEVLSKHVSHCSFLVLHWFKKSDSQKSMNIHKILGGTIIAAKTDTKMYMNTVSDADPRRTIQVSVRKGIPIEPTYLDFDPETQTSQLGTKVADQQSADKSKLRRLENEELERNILAKVASFPGRSKGEIVRLVGGNADTVGKKIDELVKAGYLIIKRGGKRNNAMLLYSAELRRERVELSERETMQNGLEEKIAIYRPQPEQRESERGSSLKEGTTCQAQ
jgi:hypothetical protein